jgi:hypothetical protein
MKATGIALIVLALVIGIVPVFTDCQSQGRALNLQNGKTVPMKCHWTGVAEAALALPLVGAGVAMILSRRKETHRSLAAVSGLLGITAILLPTVLIGVCSSPDMICNMIMRPALIMGGVLATAVSAFVLFRERGSELSVRNEPTRPGIA